MKNTIQEIEVEGNEGYHLRRKYDDTQLIQKIMKAVSQEESVATASKNIQVIVDHGVVILRGEVFSDDEKMIIVDAAIAYAGSDSVVNQLEMVEELE